MEKSTLNDFETFKNNCSSSVWVWFGLVCSRQLSKMRLRNGDNIYGLLFVQKDAILNICCNKSSPKVIWEERIALIQLCNKVPIGYNGTPQIHPKIALPFDDHHPYLIHPSLDRSNSSSQRHPDPISRFATIQFSDRQTDTQTDRWARQQFNKISAYAG